MSNTKKTAIMSFLRKLMEQRKLLISHLAKDMGVSHPVLSRWLTGDDVPSTVSCRKIAAYSGVPVEEILVMAGHLDEARSEPAAVWPEFRQYANLKYPDLLDEDIIIMVEDLIDHRLRKRTSTR